jgi:ribosomal protein L37AE/L43A
LDYGIGLKHLVRLLKTLCGELVKSLLDVSKLNKTMKSLDKKKLILTCCFDCGKKYGTKKAKGAIGVWTDVCDICGEKKPCASAPHDFGIYSNDEIRKDDEFQDLI